jgi:hypothetical protein
VESSILSKRIEGRSVRALCGERSFTLVFPKEFAIELGIEKGDFLKCIIDSNKLILEKDVPWKKVKIFE